VDRRKSILVVDDDQQVLFFWQSALEKYADRYHVVTASNGRDALAKIHLTDFDLLITDLKMPEMNGEQLTQKVRELAPNTIVVWTTAFNCEATDAEARRLAVHCCLDKPVNLADIRQLVVTVLEVDER
jgi:DNA-binding NtrC family response regulator